MVTHSFTEYRGTTEQDTCNGKIAMKSYANFTIRHYGSATTVAFDGCEEESPIKDDTQQNIRYNMHTVFSFTAEIDFSGKEEETQTNRD